MAGAGQHGQRTPQVAGNGLARLGRQFVRGVHGNASSCARSAGMEASCASRWANAARRRSTNWRSTASCAAACAPSAASSARHSRAGHPCRYPPRRPRARSTAVARPHRRTRRSRPWCRPPAVTSRAPVVAHDMYAHPSVMGQLRYRVGAHRTPPCPHPAQQESCFTSLLKVCAASFNPSTIVR
nr:hypothetical protein BNIPNGOD_00085 [Salmonella enterica subsp. enterica serovar Typhimurium]